MGGSSSRSHIPSPSEVQDAFNRAFDPNKNGVSDGSKVLAGYINGVYDEAADGIHKGEDIVINGVTMFAQMIDKGFSNFVDEIRAIGDMFNGVGGLIENVGIASNNIGKIPPTLTNIDNYFTTGIGKINSSISSTKSNIDNFPGPQIEYNPKDTTTIFNYRDSQIKDITSLYGFNDKFSSSISSIDGEMRNQEISLKYGLIHNVNSLRTDAFIDNLITGKDFPYTVPYSRPKPATTPTTSTPTTSTPTTSTPAKSRRSF